MKDKYTFRLVVTNARKEIIKSHAEKFYNGNVTLFINKIIDYIIKNDFDKYN